MIPVLAVRHAQRGPCCAVALDVVRVMFADAFGWR
jgi:hypothetical protein